MSKAVCDNKSSIQDDREENEAPAHVGLNAEGRRLHGDGSGRSWGRNRHWTDRKLLPDRYGTQASRRFRTTVENWAAMQRRDAEKTRRSFPLVVFPREKAAKAVLLTECHFKVHHRATRCLVQVRPKLQAIRRSSAVKLVSWTMEFAVTMN